MYKLLFAAMSVIAQEPADQAPPQEEIATLSEAVGHLIGQNLLTLGVPLDVDALARGLQHAAAGEKSPLSEEDCMKALASLQEASIARLGEKNLQEANAFLANNKETTGIISLEEGKIQYEVVKKGSGEEIQAYSAPLVRYKGHYLNGPPIPETEDLIDLTETIPGLSSALLGMKEGELRTLYIHPAMGYWIH